MEYKNTIFLPKTSFEMRANLPLKEPKILENWDKQNIYKKLRENSKGKEKFVLHDGPPYANGHIHMGTALNKILKDVIVRTQQMTGKDSIYVPGWDCHGLPIEWKIEEEYRKKGKNKDDVPIVQFRKECREFAEKWINIQKKEFRRLGVEGDWDNPYLTMSNEAEAQIVRELGKFLLDESLYKGARPVLWSVVEKTALADAEVEYEDHTSNTIYVKFKVKQSKINELVDNNLLIWTTTPWTIPGNRALAYSSEIQYTLIEIQETTETSLARIGDKIVIAEELKQNVFQEVGINKFSVIKKFIGKELINTVCEHPFKEIGYDFSIRALEADFVTLEQGTGIVHIAPGHGADDYNLGIKNGIDVVQTVNDDGKYNENVKGFEGEHVYKVDLKIADKLKDLNKLIYLGKLRHSYPHSWRSKAPLIFRNTPQWFISMEKQNLREKALKSIDVTKFYPPQGQLRLRSMIETRPDWCISRQRVWGVPLPLFVNKKTGQPLRDQNVINRIADIYEKEGSDSWFIKDPEYFLGKEYNSEDYEQIKDVVEVWFDSGSTHAFCLEKRDDLKWPASMYLEGSDQHRGWFHSSLLESSGTRGRAPYESVLTHGFVVDGKGRKMSKSLGNAMTPDDILKKYGVDILRLWVVASDYYDDLKLDNFILQAQTDSYRRIRNTFRYLIGNLHEFQDKEKISISEFPELEKYILHRLWEVDQIIQECIDTYNFHLMFTTLLNFCSNDLSSFYFDIRKDTIYCDTHSSNKRRAARTLLDILFDFLIRWLAPSLVFTCEEAWQARGNNTSIHLKDFLKAENSFKNHHLSETWQTVKNIRKVITGALEKKRADKYIGSSLEAHAEIYLDNKLKKLMQDVDFSEIAIISSFEIKDINESLNYFSLDEIEGVSVNISKASGSKCQRCWKYEKEINSRTICQRCEDAISI
ncbi:MAG: Isoleucine--tRNA ligase [Alphaproteobacteria bacterium MarineAlpha5_Bin8]|nr:MAG: Isoleucine--tRNA ligase [Alphaproteobacteria bacterium MarineAlpha5_Bin7]PPR48047.1 MAG: Isoleucine--tRNA ligase [Alphaproteobacteria bacterium MarineAlpha5_Bin8]PPR54662.1 MAG: Isoleucine--tRNA ligase [Alphaproteobacteria bacterium MarineAlpha5_Bin6]|tara:strand:+ start:2646 stop:5423 length:2778 start_codon:yes stop_codon:yes gene_type:complete